MTTTTTTEQAVSTGGRECSSCAGEGYRYVEQAGRQRREPVVEIRCDRCHGTGLVAA